MTAIRRLLIANRGEIACRVIASAQAMGIETVAVYSDADKNARHVRMADQAVRVGPGPASESYLLSDVILDAARKPKAMRSIRGMASCQRMQSLLKRFKRRE